ncbi:hypothetical protein A6U86_05550 [Rhizobium sp. AC27/96]|uniref:hypothetical protein n=1 Tax=Rhizobium sp. AC27/96 TaxID=1841653 RepID=UPI000828F494|nr:hypothetical protein [Rhizobium sp. AC27/96]OCJ12487.1 hypothetical protein A6U86_05550 [Rhizobium sp. AC27/96]
MHYETYIKAKYQAVTARLRFPKGGIIEPKVVRPKEEYEIAPPKPQRQEVHSKIDFATLAQIREDYEAGIAVERICKRFHISGRTVRALRQKHEWPIRERVKPRAKG